MTVDEAYARCSAMTRAEAGNFHWGFMLLPGPRRRSIHAAYAWSRRADDSVDSDQPIERKRAAVEARRREVSAIYAGAVDPADPVLVALADSVARHGIPRRHLDHLVDGVEMDLTRSRYADYAELETYCDAVAGAVGLISLHIFGFSDPAAPEHARRLGLGLQLINIMRDVQEDAARDRIYLPADELAAHGVTEREILEGTPSSGFRAVMGTQARRARAFLADGERLLPLLDRRARICVATMASLYRDILRGIERRDHDVFGTRVRLSGRRKLAIAARCAAGDTALA